MTVKFNSDDDILLKNARTSEHGNSYSVCFS